MFKLFVISVQKHQIFIFKKILQFFFLDKISNECEGLFVFKFLNIFIYSMEIISVDCFMEVAVEDKILYNMSVVPKPEEADDKSYFYDTAHLINRVKN